MPSAVVTVDGRLPLTPNGKLDGKALPEPDWAGLAGDAAPTTDAERVLADAFAEVLGLPSVGVHDSFFELGGDSIVAIQLVGRARAAGLVITPREVFQHRTVAALAATVGPARVRSRPAPARRGTGVVPATPIIGWLRDLARRSTASTSRPCCACRPTSTATGWRRSCSGCWTTTTCCGPAHSRVDTARCRRPARSGRPS